MTTARGGIKRLVGRPPNSIAFKSKQKNTLNSIFAATSLDPDSKKKKKKQSSSSKTGLTSATEKLVNNVTDGLQEEMIMESTKEKDIQENAAVE